MAEFEFVTGQAKTAGIPLAEFIRRRALSVPVQPAPEKADATLLREINSIGVNINQIARNLNSGRAGQHGVDWSAVQAELRRVLKKVGAAIQ